MKPAAARTVHTVEFGNKPAPRRDSAPQGRVPRVARLLALAHKIDGMIGWGEIKNLSDASRRLGVTRARMTQIMNLLLLAPEIQEMILDLRPIRSRRDPISERALRKLAAEPHWESQRPMWSRRLER